MREIPRSPEEGFGAALNASVMQFDHNTVHFADPFAGVFKDAALGAFNVELEQIDMVKFKTKAQLFCGDGLDRSAFVRLAGASSRAPFLMSNAHTSRLLPQRGVNGTDLRIGSHVLFEHGEVRRIRFESNDARGGEFIGEVDGRHADVCARVDDNCIFGERKAEVVFPVHDDLLKDRNVGSPDSQVNRMLDARMADGCLAEARNNSGSHGKQ